MIDHGRTTSQGFLCDIPQSNDVTWLVNINHGEMTSRGSLGYQLREATYKGFCYCEKLLANVLQEVCRRCW